MFFQSNGLRWSHLQAIQFALDPVGTPLEPSKVLHLVMSSPLNWSIWVVAWVVSQDITPTGDARTLPFPRLSTWELKMITYSNRTRLLPNDEQLFGQPICGRNVYYRLPYLTPNSPELLFDNFTRPLSVSQGEQFQIWFGEASINCDSDNTWEKACVQVYGLFV